MAEIGAGLLVFLGVGKEDDSADCRYLAEKIVHLRIFEDEQQKMNRSLRQTGGQILLVSQFTLFADTRKGRRPGFSDAAPPEQADLLYLETAACLRAEGIEVQTGRFQAHMQVTLCNDGPVTLLIDSKKQS
ncbi:MAG: D-tyrosyl-tRNA(Tyr) deacylase [Negativicutes bacterium]|nr:D-tyrosyl-tRNA(Tyr) deacylase [Negativicutes bacterium]